MRFPGLTPFALAAVVMTTLVVPAASAGPAPANTVAAGPYVTVGSYDNVCVDDNVAADTLGLPPTGLCAAMPAPAVPMYTDSVYCRAAGTKNIDSDGNVWWTWATHGYVTTNDPRAVYGSITCQMTESHDSITNWGPLPGTVNVAGTLVTASDATGICAYGSITYKYNNNYYSRYLGNGPC